MVVFRRAGASPGLLSARGLPGLDRCGGSARELDAVEVGPGSGLGRQVVPRDRQDSRPSGRADLDRGVFQGLHELGQAAGGAQLGERLAGQQPLLRIVALERSLREEQCAITVAESAAPLRTSAASILELEGREPLPPKEALEAVVSELGQPQLADLLPHFSEARERRVLPAGEAAAILFRTLELARALYERATRLS